MAHPSGKPYSKTGPGTQRQVRCLHRSKNYSRVIIWNCLLESPKQVWLLGQAKERHTNQWRQWRVVFLFYTHTHPSWVKQTPSLDLDSQIPCILAEPRGTGKGPGVGEGMWSLKTYTSLKIIKNVDNPKWIHTHPQNLASDRLNRLGLQSLLVLKLGPGSVCCPSSHGPAVRRSNQHSAQAGT